MASAATPVEVTCLCGQTKERLQLASALPVMVSPCSCNGCRYSTGVLYFSCLPLASKPTTVATLRRYDSTSTLSRYFCAVCGSHMYVHTADSDSWKLCSGVVDRVTGHEQVFRLSLEHVVRHEFVGDTKDGGLAVCLADSERHSSGSFHLQDRDTAVIHVVHGEGRSPLGGPADAADSTSLRSTNTQFITSEFGFLGASCHCGGVQFFVTHPNEASRACSSPFPDLLVPYHSSSSANPEDVKWWLRTNDSKYLAGTCACRSCRLGSGSPIQAWAFVPKANIIQPDGTPLRFDTGTLRCIESSPRCYREFCSVCGATVFWHCQERPELIDVSVGVLRAPEGARAETWLEWWTERVSFREQALDQKLIGTLEKGLAALRRT